MFSCQRRKKSGEFRVTIHDRAAEFRLAVEGSFTAADVFEVEQCWRTAVSIIGDRPFVVDLTGVVDLEMAATDLLERMQEDGAVFVAGGHLAPLATVAMSA